jgi:hypothetical protein
MQIKVLNPKYKQRHLYFYPIDEFNYYEGMETQLKHVNSVEYLCLTTGIKDFPIRVIDRKMIVKNEPQESFISKYFGVTERRKVEGSKGNTYDLIKTNGKWTCNCPGFEFRKICKHVKELV